MKCIAKNLEEKSICTGYIRFPKIDELEFLSNDERYCVEHGFHFTVMKDEYKLEDIRQLLTIFGEELAIQNKKQLTYSDRVIRTTHQCHIWKKTLEQKRHQCILIGPCVALQGHLMGKDTVISGIQTRIGELYDYQVEGIPIAYGFYERLGDIIKTLLTREGDLVLFCNPDLEENDAKHFLDLTPLYNSRGEERWFTDDPMHLNQRGSDEIASAMYEFIEKIIPEIENQDTILSFPECLEEEEKAKVGKYVEKYKHEHKKGEMVGAIVMNCNPYTKGHEHLIHYASGEVDLLYVFVVEEDTSLFPFEHRINMVKLNTKKYKNVWVLPSGRTILSKTTLPTYFSKSSVQKEILDASTDLRLFALGIAPALHITKRFVGEEPTDHVTAQYNKQMKEILPHYGVRVIEIPRMEIKGDVISASKVRRYIAEGDYKNVQRQLTNESYQYLTSLESL